MGNSASSGKGKSYESGIYVPVNGTRMRGEECAYEPSVIKNNVQQQSLLKTQNFGVWSIKFSDTLGPIPRIGHFTVFDQANSLAYIGYGYGNNGNLLNDVWVINTITLKWRRIPLVGTKIEPRTDASAVLYGRFIYVFGGYNGRSYLDQFHAIDLTTGKIELLQTTGDAPCPRSKPIFAFYNGLFYVWGGFNGQLPTELHILDPQTKIWEMIPQDVIGRKSIPYVVVDDKILSYGGNKSGGMLIVDMPQKKVYVRITTGASPPSRVLDPGMTVYGKYLFYYGGRDTTTNHTFMYVCDTERYWWFIMHVLPDDETVSMSDGIVCKIGLFMLPRLHSFSFLCEQRKRELYVFLGAPEKDQVPISVVQIYEPISILNMRDDMLCAFEGDTGLKVSAFL